jgi:hypothetical protein
MRSLLPAHSLAAGQRLACAQMQAKCARFLMQSRVVCCELILFARFKAIRQHRCSLGRTLAKCRGDNFTRRIHGQKKTNASAHLCKPQQL